MVRSAGTTTHGNPFKLGRAGAAFEHYIRIPIPFGRKKHASVTHHAVTRVSLPGGLRAARIDGRRGVGLVIQWGEPGRLARQDCRTGIERRPGSDISG